MERTKQTARKTISKTTTTFFQPQSEFSKLKVIELKELCKQKGFIGLSTLKKADFIALLEGTYQKQMIGDDVNYEDLNVNQLKEVCKKKNIVDYSKKNKNALLFALTNDIKYKDVPTDYSKYENIDYKTCDLKELKELCKYKKIEGITGRNASELRELIELKEEFNCNNFVIHKQKTQFEQDIIKLSKQLYPTLSIDDQTLSLFDELLTSFCKNINTTSIKLVDQSIQKYLIDELYNGALREANIDEKIIIFNESYVKSLLHCRDENVVTYITLILQYLVVQILDIGSQYCKYFGRKRINIYDVCLGIKKDKELFYFFTTTKTK